MEMLGRPDRDSQSGRNNARGRLNTQNQYASHAYCDALTGAGIPASVIGKADCY